MVVSELKQLSNEKDNYRIQLEEQTFKMKEEISKIETQNIKFKQVLQEKSAITANNEKLQLQLKEVSLDTSSRITSLEINNQQLLKKIEAKKIKIRSLKAKLLDLEEQKVLYY